MAQQGLTVERTASIEAALVDLAHVIEVLTARVTELGARLTSVLSPEDPTESGLHGVKSILPSVPGVPLADRINLLTTELRTGFESVESILNRCEL